MGIQLSLLRRHGSLGYTSPLFLGIRQANQRMQTLSRFCLETGYAWLHLSDL